MSKRRNRKRWFQCFYGSYRADRKVARLKAKRALRSGEEPEPKYRTGKFWND